MVFQGNGTNLLPPFVANLQFGQPLAICQWSLWHSLVKAEKFVYIYVSSCLFGKPNWGYTMWNFQVFSATQILREINFGHFEAPKNCCFDHLNSSEF